MIALLSLLLIAMIGSGAIFMSISGPEELNRSVGLMCCLMAVMCGVWLLVFADAQ